MRWLVTGAAGFIGFHLARRLLADGHEVVGIDGFTPYYDLTLKEARHAILQQSNRYRGYRLMLEDREALAAMWAAEPFDRIVHLAAQAGVRHSLEQPRSYIESNIVGTFNLMELIRARPVEHFMLASTSSVYGANTQMPFHETDRADHPLTIYAATKKATELMTHSYAHLFAIPTTAFRFFTVYGPWGRPDMALFKFTRATLAGEAIDIFNGGDMQRDFTYIDDLIEGIVRLGDAVPQCGMPAGSSDEDSLSPAAPFRVVNIGGGVPVPLMDYVKALEEALQIKARCNFLPMQQGDFKCSDASPALLQKLTGFRPQTNVQDGVAAFVAWYRNFYGA